MVIVVQRGLISALINKLYELLVWILLSELLALMVALAMLVFFSQELGLQHIKQLWHAQLYITLSCMEHTNFCPVWMKHFVITLQTMNNKIEIYLNSQKWLFVFTNMINHSKIIFLKTLVVELPSYIEALCIVTTVILLRLILLVLFTPLFVLLGSVALIDGLVQRDLRRFNGQRESALLYHWSRRWLWPCVTWSGCLYLLSPIALWPHQLLLPAAILFSFTLASTTKRFKKYL